MEKEGSRDREVIVKTAVTQKKGCGVSLMFPLETLFRVLSETILSDYQHEVTSGLKGTVSLNMTRLR